MANIRSAEKDIRKTTVRTAHNQTVKSRIRTLRKKVIAALDKKDAVAAAACLSEFASATDKAAKTKVLKKNTSSRLKSRLAEQPRFSHGISQEMPFFVCRTQQGQPKIALHHDHPPQNRPQRP